MVCSRRHRAARALDHLSAAAMTNARNCGERDNVSRSAPSTFFTEERDHLRAVSSLPDRSSDLRTTVCVLWYEELKPADGATSSLARRRCQIMTASPERVPFAVFGSSFDFTGANRFFGTGVHLRDRGADVVPSASHAAGTFERTFQRERRALVTAQQRR